MKIFGPILLAVLLLAPALAICQSEDSHITSIKPLYRVMDTVLRDPTSVTMNVLWRDSVIKIRKTTSLKYDLAYARKFRRDSTYVPTQKDTLSYNELRRIASQNCHSYALERYFDYHGIWDKELFTNMTVVTENEYMGKILATCFKELARVKTKPRRNLQYNFKRGSILVFRNKWQVPIHTVFYDGYYHSKYGAWPAKAERDLKPVIERYWDTTVIEEFQLDSVKVNYYLRGGKG